jgi:hypothetical protein
MRLIGLAERALELMCRRADDRVAFGKPLSEQGVTRERIAEARILIDQARLLTLKAAWMMDTVGNKAAQGRDRDDQGGGAQHGLPGDRLGDPGVRRRAIPRTRLAPPELKQVHPLGKSPVITDGELVRGRIGRHPRIPGRDLRRAGAPARRRSCWPHRAAPSTGSCASGCTTPRAR